MIINRVPNEILFKIIQHLPIKELSSIELVSKKFKAIVDDDLIWKNLIKQNYLPKNKDQAKNIFMNNFSARKFEYVQSDEKGDIFFKRLNNLPENQLIEEAIGDSKIAEFILDNEYFYNKILLSENSGCMLTKIAISNLISAKTILNNPIFYRKILENNIASKNLFDILIHQPEVALIIFKTNELYQKISNQNYLILKLKEIALTQKEVAILIFSHEELYSKFFINSYSINDLRKIALTYYEDISVVINNKEELCKLLEITYDKVLQEICNRYGRRSLELAYKRELLKELRGSRIGR
ncbi:MAG: F-box domain-containing protein [Glomeribacter sp. 1016415]|nr:F-box domain-containing protein [Glomeribacter sp. 1016415]